MEYKDLDSKHKLEHIWEYYKIHIIATIFAVIMVIWVGVSIWQGAHTVIALDVTIIGGPVDQEDVSILQKELEVLFKEKGIKGDIVVDAINLESKDPSIQMASSMSFFAKTASKEIDLILSTSNEYDYYFVEGYFAPLDDLFAQGTLHLDDSLKVRSLQLDTNEEKIFGLDITRNPKFAGIAERQNGLILTLFANSKRQDNAIEAMKYFIQK